MGGKIPDKNIATPNSRSAYRLTLHGFGVIPFLVRSLTRGQILAGRIDDLPVLVFRPDEEANKGCGSRLLDHGLDLPDHAAFANAGIRKWRAAVARVVEKIVVAVPRQRIGGSLQRALRIELKEKTSVFLRQGRRA